MRPALYSEALLAHFRHPAGRGLPRGAVVGDGDGGACGDALRLGVAAGAAGWRLGFEGRACAVSVASASLLCTHFDGADTATLRGAGAAVQAWLAGGSLPSWLAPLAAVREYPGRHGCLLLPWQALGAALDVARGGRLAAD